MIFLRVIFTLLRQLFVVMLYFVALISVIISYGLFKEEAYLAAFVACFVIPAAIIVIHLITAKLLKRYDITPDEDTEQIMDRQHQIHRLF